MPKDLNGWYLTGFFEAIYGRYEFFRGIGETSEEDLIPLLLTSHPTTCDIIKRDDQKDFTKKCAPS